MPTVGRKRLSFCLQNKEPFGSPINGCVLFLVLCRIFNWWSFYSNTTMAQLSMGIKRRIHMSLVYRRFLNLVNATTMACLVQKCLLLSPLGWLLQRSFFLTCGPHSSNQIPALLFYFPGASHLSFHVISMESEETERRYVIKLGLDLR